MVDGNKLNPVLEFIYLGITISTNGCIDDEIQSLCLRQKHWNNHHVIRLHWLVILVDTAF